MRAFIPTCPDPDDYSCLALAHVMLVQTLGEGTRCLSVQDDPAPCVVVSPPLLPWKGGAKPLDNVVKRRAGVRCVNSTLCGTR